MRHRIIVIFPGINSPNHLSSSTSRHHRTLKIKIYFFIVLLFLKRARVYKLIFTVSFPKLCMNMLLLMCIVAILLNMFLVAVIYLPSRTNQMVRTNDCFSVLIVLIIQTYLLVSKVRLIKNKIISFL